MAEAASTTAVEENKEFTESKEKGDGLECAVCLQPCIHPAQLPCGHIFCFLCIKGIANQSKKCAMCRQEIPRDFIEHPVLLNTESSDDASENFDGNYQWFYEGRNEMVIEGWWMYDYRTSEDIEDAFQMELEKFEILICGELYVIDLQRKVQYAKYRPWRKRNIMRNLPENIAYKGWWQYDERTSKELESCYKSGERICELLIAGFLYVADMESMLQIRRNDPSRRRRIKRDLATIPKKGVAGLRTENETPSPAEQEISYNTEVTRPHSPTEGNTDGLTPTTPSNTPQSPTSGRESPQNEDLEATIDRIRTLRLNTDDRLHQRHFSRQRRNNEH